MTSRRYIKNVGDITLYLIVLYYLLPFRPIYLYYSAHHASSDILHELKKEKANQDGNNISFNPRLNQNNDTFPKKDASRFFLDSGFIIPALFTDKFIFINENEALSFLQSDYQNPLVLFNSGRGPPSA